MIKREHRALGLTDAVVQRELKSIGVDVNSLLKDTAAEEKELRKVHKKLLALVRPPTLPGDLLLEIPPDPNVFDVKPPAFEGFGTHCAGLDRGINLALGEANLLVSEQGDGWGWQATAGSPCLTTLVFEFTPPRAGDILVDAFVDFKGQFALSAHDHWYTNANADIVLSVSSRLYQHYWEFGPSVTLIDEHRASSSNSGWIDQLVRLSYSTSISADLKSRLDVMAFATPSEKGTHETPERLEYRQRFGLYLRKGQDAGVRELEAKAMSVGSDQDGGYTVEADKTGPIITRLFDTSPMRSVANIVTISTDALEGLVDRDEGSGSWVGETGTRAETDTPVLGTWRIPVNELFAKPKVTQKLLDDSSVDIEAWLGGKVAEYFARTQNTAFVTGNGVSKQLRC